MHHARTSSAIFTSESPTNSRGEASEVCKVTARVAAKALQRSIIALIFFRDVPLRILW